MKLATPTPGKTASRLLAAAGVLAVAALLALCGPRAAQAQDAAPPADGSATLNLYFPLIENDFTGVTGDRIGFAGIPRLDLYPTVNGLGIGWYHDWWNRTNPQRPRGIEYAQTVRLHQNLTCRRGTTPDRAICPYAQPYGYTTEMPLSYVADSARAMPGSIWFIGNEIDSRDVPGSHQDEILPELYAVAYHDIYHTIKQADPTARVANGSVIQVTDLRVRYLDRVWNSYRERYGEDMPVDVWNIHNYIGPEMCRYEQRHGRRQLVCYNMGIPAGESVLSGAYLSEDWRHTDHQAFDQQIRRMRQWMKDHGQMGKPLVITEYGVLNTGTIHCPNLADANPRLRESAEECYAAHPDGVVRLDEADNVHEFMLWSFDYLLNARDCTLSAVDDCRLVQRWAWFSLESSGGYNPHGQLFDLGTREMTAAGRKFGQWAFDNQDALELD